MLYAMLAACATLIFVLALAVPRTAESRRLARLFRAQEEWAELMDRQAMLARLGQVGKAPSGGREAFRVGVNEEGLIRSPLRSVSAGLKPGSPPRS